MQDRPDADETLLVLLVQRGDAAAFEALIRLLHRPMRAYIAKLTDDTVADDLLQEVFLLIYRKVGFLREPRVFRAWVYRIATRIAFAHLKKEKFWRRREDDGDTFRGIADPGPLQDTEQEAAFLDLANRVSPASRAVLLLHYQQHLSLEETAAILDIPVGTAKSRLAYGVAALRRYFEEKKQ